MRTPKVIGFASLVLGWLLIAAPSAHSQSVQQSTVSNPQIATSNGPWGASRLNAHDRIAIEAPEFGVPGYGICRSVLNNGSTDIFVPWKTPLEWTAFLNAVGKTPSLANVTLSQCCQPMNATVCGAAYNDPVTGNPVPLGYRTLGTVLNGELYTIVGNSTNIISTPIDPAVQAVGVNNWGAANDILGPLKSSVLGINYEVTYVCDNGNWVKTREIGSCTPVNGACASPGYMTAPPADLQTLCGPGSTFANLQPNATGWTWTCKGSGLGTSDALCQAYNQAPVDGSCGSINGTGSYDQTQMDAMTPLQLCSTGTLNGTYSNGNNTWYDWFWTCNGQYGGALSGQCQAASSRLDGICGGDNGQTFGLGYAPGGSLCQGSGTASVPLLNPVTNVWSWTCTGAGAGSLNATCGANYNPGLFSGGCGSDNGGNFADGTLSPTDANLCSSGTVGGFSGSSSSVPYYWTWTCTGGGGGYTASCGAYDVAPINGTCGSDNMGFFPGGLSSSDANLCSSGTSANFNFTPAGTPGWFGIITQSFYSWTCNGNASGSSSYCQAFDSNSQVNGMCGSAAGVPVLTAPSTNLCSQGTWTSVNQSGDGQQWLWICNGSGGGTTSSCSAPVQQPYANGACGTANGTAIPNTPNFNLCSSGTPSAIGGTGPWTWTCGGTGGGSNSGACSAFLCQACQGTTTRGQSTGRSGSVGACQVQGTASWTETDALIPGTATSATLTWQDILGGFSDTVAPSAAQWPTFCPPCYMQIQSVSNAKLTVNSANGNCQNINKGDVFTPTNLSVQ